MLGNTGAPLFLISLIVQIKQMVNVEMNLYNLRNLREIFMN